MRAFENHWHSGPLHILLHLHTISSITTSASDILSNNSCSSSIIHLCSSWLLVSFFGSKYILHTHFLLIGPHGMKHKGTLNLQGGSVPESTSPFLILNIWYLKLFTSHRAVYEAITHSLCPKYYSVATEATSSSSASPCSLLVFSVFVLKTHFGLHNPLMTLSSLEI